MNFNDNHCASMVTSSDKEYIQHYVHVYNFIDDDNNDLTVLITACNYS